ncbi:MAG: hypothetical protein FJ144_20610 [Deltaproteobacteria bacterium]|nr:hypothetical protein [Deltaproteobacteria bacterium]
MAIALDTLAYAKRLREAGFSEQQAEGQAQALAAAMTDSLATKQDLRELELRMDARFAHVDARFVQVDARFVQVDARFEQLEKQIDLRFAEHSARFDARLADLERRMTMRLGGIVVASFGVFSALVKLL